MKDSVLGKGVIPYMSKVFGFTNSNKFSNKNVYKLEGMPISEVRELLLEEVAEVKALPPSARKEQFQKLFTKILAIQPTFFKEQYEREIRNTEQRLYADIIATPGFLDDEVVRDFILNHFQVSDKTLFKHMCLEQIINLYDKLSPESIEKFNYCFRSSSIFACALLYDDIYFNQLLTDRTLSMFNKETFSQIFRFSEDYAIETMISEYLLQNDDRALFIISQMCDNVYKQVGHTSEFIEAVMSLKGSTAGKKFTDILIEYYDRVVVSQENEEAFKETIKDGLPYELREMVNAILDYSNTNNPFMHSETLDEFMENVSNKRKENHLVVFGEEGLNKFINGTFEVSDFKAITDSSSLHQFKKAILFNIYGINREQADYIVHKYGQNLDSLVKCVADKDKDSLEILKSIISISSVTLDNQEGIKLLQEAYWKYMQEKGLDYQKKSNSSVILGGLFNRMYMNTYNSLLYKDLGKEFLVDDGVPLIDAGVDFNMIVTSLNGTSKFFQKGVNIASKWNTAFRDIGQGLCTSFINNENLGVISLNGPLLGFVDIPQDALNTMGTTDIYSFTNIFNLRSNNRKREAFVVGSEMANETRYGYNEMLIDRFLATDDEGKVKLQPAYVVYYKTQDNYRMSNKYVETLKTAKDFGIPIVVVDYYKVQAHERTTIKDMEDTLFKNDVVDQDLLGAIMTRYMNNISGNRIINGHPRDNGLGLSKDKSFPEKDLGQFIDQVIDKCETISDDELRQGWIKALQNAYDEEKRKHIHAVSVKSYHCSIGRDKDAFNLITDYNLAERLSNLHTKYNKDVVKEEDPSFRKGEIPTEVEALVELVNTLEFDTTYVVSKAFDAMGESGYSVAKKKPGLAKISLEEKLIVAYFTDNYSDDLLSKLSDDFKGEIEFGTTKEIISGTINKNSLVDKVEHSYLLGALNKGLDMDKINTFIGKLEKMDDKQFLKIFGGQISKIAETEHRSNIYIADKFLEKKANFGNEFIKLNEVMTNINSEEKKAK